MGKTLIITEKPSVAQDIAKAVGGFKKGKEYYDSKDYLLSWAVGHLLELAVPESMKEQDKWTLNKLPIMPPQFDLAPAEKMGNRIKLLTKLLASKEVTDAINACDAGREGELIFRYIYQYAKSDKPIRRLWLQSMTTDAIRDGFERLRSDVEMQPLAEAARCRNEADWLIGINATRVFTLRLIGGKGSTVTSLGRVQTPTLAIIVDREKKIQDFRERILKEVFATFRPSTDSYVGRWFDENYKKQETEIERTDRLLRRLNLKLTDWFAKLDPEFGSLWEEHRGVSRLWIWEIALAIEKKCVGKPGVVEVEEKKPTTQAPPQLYDLTTLQREANNRFSFSARRTLQIAQALYERHKAITYPRTDSRCLPEDYVPTVKKTLKALGGSALGAFAAKVLAQDWVRPNKRIFNNVKVSDHFAIIPTANPPSGLDGDEQVIYDMVAKRFIAIFYPAAQFEVTTRITRVEGEPFKTEGKIMIVPGWLEVYGKETEKSGEATLPAVQQGERVTTESIEIKEDKTKPPARYTEATILSAMEGAGKLVEDEELAEAMKEHGLGTPATRAQIIENLVGVRYLNRHGKELQPTSKAMQTIGLLKNVAPELVSPELTGEWEYKLREIERKQLSRDKFMKEIRDLTAHIVKEAKDFVPDEQVESVEPFGACPKCGQPLQERFKSFECGNDDCDFVIWKTVAGRMFSRAEVETLTKDRKIGPLGGFRSKANRRFDAIVKFDSEFKVEFDFEATTAATLTDIKCENCGKFMAVRSGRRGEFLACSGYPECKTTLNFKRDEAGKVVPLPRAPQPKMPEVDIKCEKCEKPMVIRMSRRGPFLACSGYPKCKNAKPLPEELRAQLPAAPPKPAPVMTDEKCDKCGAPMAKRQGRYGEFLGCSAYPKCKNIKKVQ
ncbi:MAG: DNA topoisomerase 3 [Verrucomicrobiia bacterium]